MPNLALIPDPWLADLLSRLGAEHSGIYLAGGRIRDWLLGREGRDIDLCFQGAAIPLARRIANATNGAFYVLDSETDAARILYQERGIVIDVAGLRGNDIISDLWARDLTLNAMAVRLEDAVLPSPPIIDPCHGRRDIEARVLRATSEEAFQRDPVRMLRAVRLEASLRFQMEPHTESWVRRDAKRLPSSSPERIRYELMQILSGRELEAHVRRMRELGLLDVALPEVARLGRSQDGLVPAVSSELDLTLQTLSVVERLTTAGDLRPDEAGVFGPFADTLADYLAQTVCDQRTRGVLLRWATLLHRTDQVASINLIGGESRRQQPNEGEDAARVTERFHFSSQEVSLVRSTVANALVLTRLAARGHWDRRDLYRYFQGAMCGPVEPLLLAWAGLSLAEAHPGAKPDLAALATDMLGNYFLHPEQLVTPPTLVTGADVMEWLGLEQGPMVGTVLRELREEQAMGVIATREEARELIRTKYPRVLSG